MKRKTKMTPTDLWKSIRNTRWVSDDGTVTRSGAKLCERLMELGVTNDVNDAVSMLYGVKRGGGITTGVSGYMRMW